ncbi:MAG: hypothetical protein HY394_01635 [Candidatus Diapherotrites archaeon]|nr:hypothetical protein [Candidatus Diapherotrites archaeon]
MEAKKIRGKLKGKTGSLTFLLCLLAFYSRTGVIRRLRPTTPVLMRLFVYLMLPGGQKICALVIGKS